VPGWTPGYNNFVDVRDVARGMMMAAERGKSGERYILGGENLTYREIADIVAAMVSRAGPRRTIPGWMLGPAGGAVTAYNRVSRRSPVLNGQQVRLSRYNLFFDSSKAVRELGYPLLPFSGAAAKAYRWYRDNGFLV
jgi:dihydroflavonol-4-reductase